MRYYLHFRGLFHKLWKTGLCLVMNKINGWPNEATRWGWFAPNQIRIPSWSAWFMSSGGFVERCSPTDAKSPGKTGEFCAKMLRTSLMWVLLSMRLGVSLSFFFSQHLQKRCKEDLIPKVTVHNPKVNPQKTKMTVEKQRWSWMKTYLLLKMGSFQMSC